MELQGFFSAVAGEPLRRGRRVVYDSVGRLVHAGADHPGIGSVAEKDVIVGEAVAVRPLFDPGVHAFISSGGIASPGAPVFAAEDGKVSIVGSVLVGYVADSELDVEFDGDVVSVIPCLASGIPSTPGSGTTNHALLTNRDAPAQHPASSIAAADGKSVQESLVELSQELGTKAPTTHGHIATSIAAADGKSVQEHIDWSEDNFVQDGGYVDKRNAVRAFFNKAAFQQGSSISTGTLKITIPKEGTVAGSVGNALEIFYYDWTKPSGIGAWKIFVSGNENSSTKSLARWVAYSYTNVPFHSLRVGYEGNNLCILLGTTSTQWSNFYFCVERALLGNPASQAVSKDWTANFITDESEITNIINVPVQGPLTGSIAHAPTLLHGYVEIDEFVQLSKTTDANLYNHLLTHCPDIVREISATHFGFNR